MHGLRIHLFGKFSAYHNSQVVKGLDATKVQELLCYLLIKRGHPNPREVLAGVLWGESSAEKSRKYLRQALWHLQTAFGEAGTDGDEGIFLIEHDWVRLNVKPSLWVDVEAFEQACVRAQGVRGRDFDQAAAESLHAAVELYTGDLLEGVYHDWCLIERERLQNLYLSTLSKLLSYCLASRCLERGLHYGALILRHDRASERTHRLLMRLHYQEGDRTAALRQYGRCVTSLNEELGVRPDKYTTALFEQMRADKFVEPGRSQNERGEMDNSPAGNVLSGVLTRLKEVQSALATAHKRVSGEIKAIELDFKDSKH